ncbi:MAG: SLBB domain-containing protein [Taibaiella sp.]|nr:SLBB domain-containing protein [Taibaiella sp.]
MNQQIMFKKVIIILSVLCLLFSFPVLGQDVPSNPANPINPNNIPPGFPSVPVNQDVDKTKIPGQDKSQSNQNPNAQTDNQTVKEDNTKENNNTEEQVGESSVEVTNDEYESEMEKREGREGFMRNAFVEGIQIYGSELFRNSYTNNRNMTNRPTPLNYMLGPGDQLLLDITGINVVSFNPTVQPDGSISLREFGRVFVGSKTIEAAREIIKARLNANNFAIDKGSSLDVNITNVRSFTITVMGQVGSPGSKVVGTFNTVLDALNLAGGITSIGSYRYVQLIRNNQIYAEIDLYKMISESDFSSNYFLEDNDMIVVPIYRTRVAMTGEVKRPGWFEVLPSESLWHVIQYAGGFKESAYTNYIKATQYTDEQKRVRDIQFQDLEYFNPVSGDRYFVDRILDIVENRVTIQGVVQRPGSFELETTGTLLKLIEKAGGLKPEAFTTRAYLTRTNAENGAFENITIDLESIINKQSPDIPLEREDILYIKSIYDMADQSTVTIAGKVRNPGTFSFYIGMTVEDLVMQGNGFSDGANFQEVRVVRRVKDSDRRSRDAKVSEVFTIAVDPYLRLKDGSFKLEPYDVVSVLPLTGYVRPVMVEIEGQVMQPGNYSLLKRSDRISDLVARSGGFTEMADLRGASLYRPSNPHTSNEARLNQYRKSMRRQDYRTEIVMEELQNGVKLEETGFQLDPNIIPLNLDDILRNPGSDKDLVLMEGDVLSIPSQKNTVEITGQVGFPTVVLYEKGKDIFDYINHDAGGFLESADRKRTKVEYRNGRSSTKTFFGSFPVVEPGSIIYVPTKIVKEKRTFELQSIVALSSTLASTAAVIIAIVRLNN